MNDSLDIKFRNLALVCAFLVVIIHCISTFKVESRFLWESGYDGFCRVAVPFFFLTSGTFLGRRIWQPGWWRRAVQKRCRSLLVPYFFWLSVYFLYRLLFLSLTGNPVDLGPKAVATAFGFNLLEYPCLRPLWYVRTLFVAVLAAPTLVWALRKVGVLPFLLLLPFRDECFFPVGIAFGMGLVDFRVNRSSAAALASVGTLLMLLRVCMPVGEWTVCLAVPFLVFGLLNLMPALRLPPLVATAAFPVFLTHMFVVSSVGVLVRSRGWSAILSKAPVLLAVAGGIFLLALVLTCGVRKLVPKASGLLWGGR